MATHYDEQEEKELARRVAEGEEPRCPRCAKTLVRHRVPPRGDVSYVRDRILLVCRGCGRSVALDRRRVQREGDGGAEG